MKKSFLSIVLLSLPITFAVVPMWVIIGLPTHFAGQPDVNHSAFFGKTAFVEAAWLAVNTDQLAGDESTAGDIDTPWRSSSEGRSAPQMDMGSHTNSLPPQIFVYLIGIGLIGFFGLADRSGAPEGSGIREIRNQSA
jgi:hypothetical protein